MPVYLLTGASRGIGLELARQLSSTPDNTILALVRSISSPLSSLQDERQNIRVVICDISSEESIASLSSILPSILGDAKVAYIINNAAVLHGSASKALDLSTSSLNANVTTNVLGPAHILQAALPFLADNALIVNMTSGIASLALVSNGTIPAGITAYSISKCALNMLTVHQAQELKGMARVVCLDPGHVKTEMGGEHAVVEIPDSARGILRVLGGLGKDVHGDMAAGRARFYSFLGDQVPW
ncbi:NAD(P)-binding protein [Lojkania enalia]|uniref:NAD(P)-binding protein n=1 Tax=Lojkania enalia TaxID=147567 RepID=A0A9P4K055_9PLEO|nr:NAD(P)-binding protein [Didymosphaeria enalia]